MATKIGSEALIPNLTLKPFEVLVGEWQTTGTHPQVPGKTFHGHTSFNWLEGGAFLLMHSEIDEPEIPSGIAIFVAMTLLRNILCFTSMNTASQESMT